MTEDIISHEVVIVGGGISGLTAAWELRDRDVLLLEADNRVGGKIKSEQRGDYWLNMGAHLFPGPGSVLDRLVQEMGLETIEIPGTITGLAVGEKVITKGAAASYPFRLPISLGARISFARAGLKIRVAAKKYNDWVLPRASDTPIQRRIRNLAFRGDETFSQLLGPLHPEVDAIISAIVGRVTATSEDLAAGSGAALFSMVWSDDSSLARNLSGGSARLPQAIAGWLGERVKTGAKVESIQNSDDINIVSFNVNGRAHKVHAKKVIVATPAHITRKIVKDLPSETADALDQIVYGPFVCGSFLTNETGPMPWDDVYAIVVANRSFNMFYNHSNPLRNSGSRQPGGSLMVYGGGDHGVRLMELTDDEVREILLKDLYDLFPEAQGVVQETIITRWSHGLPYARVGRYRLQAMLEKPLKNLFLAGDYLDWAHMEAAASSGYEAALKVRRELR